MASHKFDIIDGPDRAGVMLAWFENVGRHHRMLEVTVEINGGAWAGREYPRVTMSLQHVGHEDGSGFSFLLGGSVGAGLDGPLKGKPFEGYYGARTRKGYIHIYSSYSEMKFAQFTREFGSRLYLSSSGIVGLAPSPLDDTDYRKVILQP